MNLNWWKIDSMGNSLQMLFFSSLKDCASLKHFIPSSVKLDHGNQMVPCLVRYGVNASCVCQEGRCLEVVVFIHHVLLNKEAVKKLCGLCRICSSNRKQFKSCGVNASCSSQQEAVKKLRCRCIMFFSSRKQLKSCGVFASFGYHQGSNFKVALSMYRALLSRKQLKICGVCASCGYRQGNSLKVVLSMYLFTKQCNRCSVRVWADYQKGNSFLSLSF